MKRSAVLLAFVATSCAAQAGSPIAEVFCDDRQALVLKLEKSHGAIRQGRGMRGPETILEVWAVPSTGEWTIVQSYPSGRSCIVAMGEHWEALPVVRDPA